MSALVCNADASTNSLPAQESRILNAARAAKQQHMPSTPLRSIAKFDGNYPYSLFYFSLAWGDDLDVAAQRTSAVWE